MKDKCYKPGQLVTINGKVYRIKRRCRRILTCRECAIQRAILKHHNVIDSEVCLFCTTIPYYCYPVLVKPKQK